MFRLIRKDFVISLVQTDCLLQVS